MRGGDCEGDNFMSHGLNKKTTYWITGNEVAMPSNPTSSIASGPSDKASLTAKASWSARYLKSPPSHICHDRIERFWS